MRTRSWVVGIISFTLCGQILADEDSEKEKLENYGLPKKLQKPTASVISDEELAKLKKEKPSNFTKVFKDKVKEEDIPKAVDIYSTSLILVVEQTHTILPRNALLYVPQKLTPNVAVKPQGKLVLWPQFYQKNQEQITTYAVELEMVEGKKALTEETRKQFEKNGKIVVATYKGHPTSVLTLQSNP